MANENKKDFNTMLNDSKDMPKFQIITDEKSIEKYGGSRMYFAPPIDYDKIMKRIPFGSVITVGKIREYFAKLNGADFTEPITAGIFISIAAWASDQRSEDKTPYWRTLKANGELNEKYHGGIKAQKEMLEAEGHTKNSNLSGRGQCVQICHRQRTGGDRKDQNAGQPGVAAPNEPDHRLFQMPVGRYRCGHPA